MKQAVAEELRALSEALDQVAQRYGKNGELPEDLDGPLLSDLLRRVSPEKVVSH
jgi:hypothetical protein